MPKPAMTRTELYIQLAKLVMGAIAIGMLFYIMTRI